ncbi:hypothetical protein ACIQZG_14360 [Lysinibacillus sp. NPDC096418]|uniref:hypothetical protein n=1 Tax=Lysinibacillus sp. NPDC096418 TaxID=3364138 RepID=UPI0038289672
MWNLTKTNLKDALVILVGTIEIVLELKECKYNLDEIVSKTIISLKIMGFNVYYIYPVKLSRKVFF